MLRTASRDLHRRRGAVAAMVLVMLTVIIGFAALTVDVGTAYNVKADLQHAADASAIAGATALTSDAMMLARSGDDTAFSWTNTEIIRRVHQISTQNGALGVQNLVTSQADILTGWIDLDSATSPVTTAVATSTFNAIQVSVRCAEESPNGAVQYIFAPIFGLNQTNLVATATAAFDDRFVGFVPSEGQNPFVPFTIHEDVYFAAGPDAFSYDDATESVVGVGDGVTEINLYPHAEIGNGNFGLVNIGTSSESASAVAEQIESGITSQDLETEFGTSSMTFYDDWGSLTTYEISGKPGLVASLESSILSRRGQIIAVLLHDDAYDNGSNKTFHITGMRFARVMEANLNGNDKRVWLQPTTYTGSDILIGPNAPSSGGAVGQLVLVR